MKKQAFGMIQKMDMRTLEVQLALQCAPFLMGLKISNLLIVGGRNLCAAVRLMEDVGISYFMLLKTESKTVLLVYDSARLGAYVSGFEAARLLRETGYYNLGLTELLKKCRLRYTQYVSEGGVFPHELGVFLGYPVEDVAGFIRNCGKNALYTGYWKVYDDLPAKLSVFRSYENAQYNLFRMLSEGRCMREIIGSDHGPDGGRSFDDPKTYSDYRRR